LSNHDTYTLLGKPVPEGLHKRRATLQEAEAALEECRSLPEINSEQPDIHTHTTCCTWTWRKTCGVGLMINLTCGITAALKAGFVVSQVAALSALSWPALVAVAAAGAALMLSAMLYAAIHYFTQRDAKQDAIPRPWYSLTWQKNIGLGVTTTLTGGTVALLKLGFFIKTVAALSIISWPAALITLGVGALLVLGTLTYKAVQPCCVNNQPHESFHDAQPAHRIR
jgi:hypothetical protein